MPVVMGMSRGAVGLWVGVAFTLGCGPAFPEPVSMTGGESDEGGASHEGGSRPPATALESSSGAGVDDGDTESVPVDPPPPPPRCTMPASSELKPEDGANCDGVRKLDGDGCETGYASCDDDRVVRYEALACKAVQDRPCANPDHENCAGQARCSAFPTSQCTATGGSYCYCSAPCQSDAECGAGAVCACPYGGAGQCVAADCTTNADCPSGACLLATDDGCGQVTGLRCHVPERDECASDRDCSEEDWQRCAWSDEDARFVCVQRIICE